MSFESKTVAQIKALLKDAGVEIPKGTRKKSDLIALLENHTNATSSPQTGPEPSQPSSPQTSNNENTTKKSTSNKSPKTNSTSTSTSTSTNNDASQTTSSSSSSSSNSTSSASASASGTTSKSGSDSAPISSVPVFPSLNPTLTIPQALSGALRAKFLAKAAALGAKTTGAGKPALPITKNKNKNKNSSSTSSTRTLNSSIKASTTTPSSSSSSSSMNSEMSSGPSIEVKVEPMDLTTDLASQFDKSLWEKFGVAIAGQEEEAGLNGSDAPAGTSGDQAAPSSPTGEGEGDGDDQAAAVEAENEDGEKNAVNDPNDPATWSKTFRLKQIRPSMTELKQAVERPDVIETVDTMASDPILLVTLKGTRNTVAVPRHWCQKRKYLQNKRGFEKPPFKLPEYIVATGITELRGPTIEVDEKTLKKAQREKMHPSMGKMNIDYGILQDAFFRHQTRPSGMTILGDLYYEGREFETQAVKRKPGILSTELREALGMKSGDPPPWLHNMQRYGPPPSYPKIKIPGLTAPFPPGAVLGYGRGQWGAVPVDGSGVPLYGNVWGSADTQTGPATLQPIEKRRWGVLGDVAEESDSESEEEDSSDEEEDEEEQEKDISGTKTGTMTGTVTGTRTGLSSAVVATPGEGEVSLRKGGDRKAAAFAAAATTAAAHVQATAAQTGVAAGSLYNVVGERERAVGSGEAFGANRGYEISIAPEELEAGVTEATLRARYDEANAAREAAAAAQQEDYSDLFAEQERKRQRKAAKVQAEEKEKRAKRARHMANDFKF